MFDVDDLQVDSNDIDESFWLFLLPMTGTGWIHVSFAIYGHFAFLVTSEKSLETMVFSLAHDVKYWAQNSFKGGKRLKSKAIPPF